MLTRTMICSIVLSLGVAGGCGAKVGDDDGGAGGAHAEGGNGGGGGTGGSGGAGEGGANCKPSDPFVGWDGCYRPDPACCESGVDLEGHCLKYTQETQGIPYLCQVTPPHLGEGYTDFRACTAIKTSVVACEWGPSEVICCEP